MKNKLLNAFVIALILFQAVAPIGALAYTGTEKPDYQPGAIVSIFGDNSDGVGFAAGENIHVDASGPNGFAASCDAVADDTGAWSCQLTLPADAADGSYTYIATGETSGASQDGAFTVTAPPAPTQEPTQESTQVPTVEPTSQPTEEQPTQAPTLEPTAQPTEAPTQAPTSEPTQAPTSEPTQEPAPTATAVLSPFITSDKADYAPAEQVTLTSGNWQPGEWVVVNVNDNIGQTWSITTNKQADANGAFTYQFNLPSWFVATYQVTATGELLGVATTTFTDAANVNTTITLNAVTTPLSAGQTNVSFGGKVSVTSPEPNVPAGSPVVFGYASNSNCTGNFTTLASSTTSDPNGNYSGTFIVPAAGTYFVRANFGGASTGQGAGQVTWRTSSSACQTIIVNPSQSVTTLAVTAATGTYNGTTTLSATLSSGLNGVSGKTISFSLNGTSVGTGTTNASGVATLSGVSISGINAGTYAVGVTASFAGDSSFTASSGSASLTVGKADQTINFDALTSRTYGDADFTVSATATSGLAVTFTASGNCTISGNTVQITGAGSCTILAKQAGNANYNAAPDVSRSFNVAKASATVTLSDLNHTYDGTAKSATATTTPSGLSVSITYNGSATAPTNAAVYAVVATINEANYEGSASDTLVIGKADQTISFGALANKTYGDADFSVSASASSGLAVTFTASGKCTVSGSTVHVTGAGSCSITAQQAGNANYNPASDVSQSFNIAKAAATVTLSNLGQTYDGTAKSATVTTDPTGLTVDVTYDGSTTAPTSAGSYPVVATINDANYQGSASDTLLIGKADQTISFGALTDKTFGDADFTVSATASSGLPVSFGASGNCSISGTSVHIGGAGSCKITASQGGNGNYNAALDVDQAFSVAKAGSTTAVMVSDATYDGTPHGVSSASVTGINGLEQSLDVTYSGRNGTTYGPSTTAPTNAGDYTASATFEENGNYTGSSDSKNFTIEKASSLTAVSCTAGPFTYTGSAITPCSVAVTGAGGLNLIPAPSYTNNVTAGTAFASYTYAGDDNHDSSSDSKSFTIDKASSTTVVTFKAGPYVYRGTAFTATAVVTGAGGLDTPVEVVYSGDCTNVTTTNGCTATANFAGDTNHNGSNNTKSITITKADPTIDVTPYDVTYNGSAHTATGTAKGVQNEVLSGLVLSGTTHTDAGTYTDTWTFTDVTGNYNDASDSISDVIAKADATVVVTPYNATYNGLPRTATYTITGVNGETGATVGTVTLNTTHTNAGTYSSDTWSFTGAANYNDIAATTITDTINKATATVVVAPYNVTYDGSSHTATYTITGVNGETGATVGVVTLNTTHTNAGTYASDTWSFTGAANYNDIASTTITDTITKANAAIVVTPYNVVYDNVAHTATGTAKGVLNENLSGLVLTGTTHTNPGDYPTDAWAFTDVTGNYNNTSGTVHDNIHYATSGSCLGSAGHTILQPINVDGTSVFKQGSTVPAKFRVCDANGNSIGTTGVVTSFQQVSSVSDPNTVLNETVVSTTPDTTFRWDSSAQQWIFNMNTKSLRANTMYTYKITLNDGSTIVFSFALK